MKYKLHDMADGTALATTMLRETHADLVDGIRHALVSAAIRF